MKPKIFKEQLVSTLFSSKVEKDIPYYPFTVLLHSPCCEYLRQSGLSFQA